MWPCTRQPIAEVIFLLTIVYAQPSAFAQAGSSSCSDILGLRDRTYVSGEQKNQSAFRRYYCDHLSNSSATSSETIIDLGFSIKKIPVELGLTGKSGDSLQYNRKVCEAVEANNFSSNDLKVAVETIGKGVVEKWDNCINNRLGLQGWFEASYEAPMQVVIGVRYRTDQAPFTTQVIGSGFVMQPPEILSCQPKTLGMRDGTIGPSNQYLNCLRRRLDPVTITLHTKAGGGESPLRVPAVSKRECAPTHEVVEALYIQLFEATSANADGGELPTDARGTWISTLRRTSDLRALAKQMISHDNFARWIIESSLVGSKRGQPQAPQPQHAYGWMANSVYSSILGRYPTPEEINDFARAMPAECTSGSGKTKCRQQFLRIAEQIIDRQDFASLHSENAVSFTGTRSLPARYARYCGVASDCMSNTSWCEFAKR